MAIEYLDELAWLLIEVGITPELKRSATGVWEGSIDLTRIWAHNETPQFINFNASGQRRKRCMLVLVMIVPNYPRRIGRV